MSNKKNNSVEISLALPVFNEEKNIEKVINDSIIALNKISRPWEIIIVDNFSDDSSFEIINKISNNEDRIRVIRHKKNELYSGSSKTAIQTSSGKYVAIMDSDNQLNPSDLTKFIEKLENGNNLVFGWRKYRKDPIIRIIVSAIFNLLGKFWIKYYFHDLNCGFRMFDRSFINCLEIKHKINMLNPELFVSAKVYNLKIEEVVVEHYPRQGGNSSHNFKQIFQMLISVNNYFRQLRIRLKKGITEI